MTSIPQSFPGKFKDEEIILISRMHWFRFLERLISTLLLAIVWIVIYILIKAYLPGLLSGMWGQVFVLFSSAYALFILLFLYISWLIYYLDIWIVTDRRLIDIDQKALFSRMVAELNLDQVQDVEVNVKGIIPTLLHFGDVDVESSGAELGRFTFRSIPHPFKVEQLILELARKKTQGSLEKSVEPK